MNDSITTDWEGIKIFLTYIRSKNIEQTAKRLNVSTATVSRKINVLETNLGRPLLLRKPSGMVLSEGVNELIKIWERAEHLINTSLNEQLHEHYLVKKIIRFSTTPALACGLFFSELDGFLKNHRDINIKIDTSVSLLDFHTENIDIALRFVRPENGNLKVQKVGNLSFGVAYSKKLGSESKVINLVKTGQLPVIGWVDKIQNIITQQSLNKIASKTDSTIKVTDFSSLISGIQNGVGVGIIPHLMIKTLSDLSFLNNSIFSYQTDLWLVTEKNSNNYQHIVLFKAFIKEILIKHENSLIV